jgi:hypothetical protein
VVITAVPATHLARTTGFVAQTETTRVCFAGDTYYRPYMAEIGRRFQIDVALLPVTTYRLPMTMGEKGAALAARDLGCGVVIPIHLGVQPRSPLLRTRQTPEGFERRLRAADLETEVVMLAPGDSWEPAPQRHDQSVDRVERAGYGDRARGTGAEMVAGPEPAGGSDTWTRPGIAGHRPLAGDGASRRPKGVSKDPPPRKRQPR